MFANKNFCILEIKKNGDAASTWVYIRMFASLCVLTPREDNELAEHTFLINTYPVGWAF